MRTALIPLAAVITPNRMEAEALTGRPVTTRDEARDAARALVDLGARAAVVKGGHFDEADIVDLLFDGRTSTSSGIRASRPATRTARVARSPRRWRPTSRSAMLFRTPLQRAVD